MQLSLGRLAMNNLITYAVVTNDYLAMSVIKGAAKNDDVLSFSWVAGEFNDAISRFKKCPVDILIFDFWLEYSTSIGIEYMCGLEFASFFSKTAKNTKLVMMSDNLNAFEFTFDINNVELSFTFKSINLAKMLLTNKGK